MADVQQTLDAQREFFNTGFTKYARYRLAQLAVLKSAIKRHEREIYGALRADLNKSEFESYETEIGIVLKEISYVSRHLKNWVRPVRVKSPFVHFRSRSYVYSEPYGSVLIVSPWNYPFQLTMVPLVGAIASGNCAVVKPSENSKYTSKVISKILKECFEEDYVAVVLGGRKVSEELLQHKFDYIFFTGSVPVGKIVMQAAAKNLTPVTLELGGKSPCIVDESANIKLAARRIVWGKFLNAGQTCIAPDYVLAHENVKDLLVKHMSAYITRFYGAEPIKCPYLPKIINQKHFERLVHLMSRGDIVKGGMYDARTRIIEPTILADVPLHSQIMQEEIFGPLLPVIGFTDLEYAIDVIRSRPKPLAFYLFTESKCREREVMQKVAFGGGCVNDTVIHFSNPYLSFGGVGASGMGRYHGKASFDTFSHKKGVMKKTNTFDIPFRYPPFKNHLPIIKKFLK